MRIVLIAAKALASAKMRLGSALAASERIALAEAMYRDVLAAALGARAADRVAVVTSEPSMIDLAKRSGALAIDEGLPRGLNAAVRIATTALIGQGARTVCTILSDIPLVTGADIDRVFDAMPDEPGVVLAPSRELTGTNMILRSPAEVIPTRFGHMSLARHLDDCRRQGVAVRIERLDGPALDLDTIDDLREFMRVPGATHTFNQLARLGLAHP